MARLSEAAVAKINEICDRYVSEKTPLIVILSDIQKEYGYIPLEVQEIVSERTGIPVECAVADKGRRRAERRALPGLRADGVR